MNPTACPRGHPFTVRDKEGDFICDVCERTSSWKESSLHCIPCDYDRCIGCAAKSASLKCPTCGVKPLTHTAITRGGFRCDDCERGIDEGEAVASCRACDYDSCDSCTFAKVTGSADLATREPQPQTIQAMWQEVSRLEAKSLPKSVLEIVKDKIIPAARKADNHAQLLKATIFLAKGTVETEDVGMDVGIQVLERELKTPTFITSPSEIAFLHSMVGELYSRYLDLVRYSINSRTDPGEEAALPEDIKVWAPAQLERVAFNHYAQSIAAAEVLARENTSEYNPVLTTPFEPQSLGGRIRPTLLDFIGHRALSYFSNENSFLAEPSNRFVLRDTAAFGEARQFVSLSFTSDDTTSRRYRALLVYQSMLRAKLAAMDKSPSPTADEVFSLVELDLMRLEFVRNSLKGLAESELRARYGDALLRLLEYSRASAPAAASVLVALGNQHRFHVKASKAVPSSGGDAPPADEGEEVRFDLNKALDYYQEALRVSADIQQTNPTAYSAAQRAISEITSSTVSAQCEAVVALRSSFLLSTETKNLEGLSYRVVRLTAAEKKELNELREDSVRRAFLLAKPTVGEREVSFALSRPAADYHARRVETVVAPIASYGHHCVLVWKQGETPEDSAHFVYVPVLVSDIAVMQTDIKGETMHVAVHRTTGEPMPSVKASIYRTEWSNSKSVQIDVGSAVSDANGFIKFPTTIPENNYYEVRYSKGDDVFDMSNGYSRNRYRDHSYTQTITHFFLDRNIYRPGQTVYFKGLVVETSNSGTPKIRKGHGLTVRFRDTNHQEKETLNVVTNEYGTFEGTFTAPLTGLMGQMTIQADGGSASFRVEEYKRPRFEVTMVTPAQDVRVGGRAKVEGTAVGFSGIPLGGATVKYRVRRVARAPWFWRFWCRVPAWSGKSAEILSGTATADVKGKFTVEFTAVPDADLPAEDRPEFEYEVTADVTDITGETQTGSSSLKVGYVALAVDVPLQDTMSLNSLRALAVRLTDLNANPIKASATVTLEPLVTPYPVGCPFVARLWSEPHHVATPKDAFKKAVPQYAYSDELTPAKWARAGGRFERVVSSDGTKASLSADLDRSELRANTYYRVVVSATDTYGTPVTVSRTVQVFDSESESSVAVTSAQTPSVHFASSSYRVGDLAVVRYGKRLRFDGRPQPVLVALSTVSQAGAPEWDRTDTQNNTNVLVQERAVSITEADRGFVTSVCAFVAYGRTFISSKSVGVPWIEKQLSFEYVSFRNKLEPGQQEEWRIKVKSADPLANASEVVAAEVVAALYDASLDKLTGNSPHTFSDRVSSLFRMPSPQLSISQGVGFSTSSGYDMGRGQNGYAHPYYGYGAQYSELNWFNFPFRSERPQPRLYAMRCCAPMMSMCAAPMAMACDAAPQMMMAKGGGVGGAMKRKAKSATREIETAELNAPAPGAENEDADVAGDNDNAGNNNDDDSPAPSIRTNLKETVFFMPNLRTEADGTIVLRFTMGEALTRWRLLAFAHTPDLKSGSHDDGTIVTQKELMVTPNPPRFFREGDTISFAAKVTNMGDSVKDGTATLELLDGVTGAPLGEAYGLSPSSVPIPFSCGANGQSVAVSWALKVPFGGPSLVTWRIVARAGRTGDGEEAALPVVTNRMMVTETLPMSVRGGQSREFVLKSLAGVDPASTTLSHEAYTVEFTSNPAWYAVQALPYMMEFPHECSEQLFTRYYSNALARFITERQPQIKRVFEAWRTLGSEAMKSNLNRNEELKTALLEETPWVLESQSEEQQRKQIALLFDLNRMNTEESSALGKLRDRQMGDGGFSWFPGGRGSLFITQHIAMGLAHLLHLGVANVETGIQTKAQAFCHRELVDEYDRLLERVRLGKSKLEDQHVSHTHLLFLYTESFAKLHPSLQLQATRREVIEYYTEQAGRFWTGFGLYGQALIALIAHRNDPSSAVAKDIIKSLRERAIAHDELGTTWKYTSGYAFYEAPIETQSLMVEVFREVADDPAFVDELRLWLLKNKQTKHWKTTKQTSEAVYALLLGGESWLESSGLVSVEVGGAALPMVNPEPGTGYVKHRYDKKEVTPAMARVAVKNPNKVVAWGAAYWQYFESLDKIKWFMETPLKIKKDVFGVKISERGETLRVLSEGDGLSVGDKVRVRVEIRVDREMSYVHLKDMRASGLEPTNVLSRYKYQDGLGYYESTKDLATHFFIDHLPKGTFVFEYDLVASQRGDFSNGITTMQCMYAPEFTSHSQGIRLTIK